jgi:diacylglycerol kinase family enzyme
MAGMGIDADMIKGADRKLKNRVGVAAYFFSIIKGIFKPSIRYQVIVDDNKQMKLRAKSILVANMGKIHGGIEVVPKAHPQSGTLRIGIVKAKNWISWVSLVFHAVTGNVNKSSHYTLLKGKKIEIISLRGAQHYECDGDIFPKVKKLSVTIFPASLSIRTTF